jgi:hypothetical protein
MSLSTQDPVQAKRRWFHSTAVGASAAATQLSIAFFSWLMQQRRPIPFLQTVEFAALTGTSTVIANVACHLYAIVLKKTTTTAAYFKGSDNATTASSSAPEVSLRQNTAETDLLFFPYGLAMANGFSIASNTTGGGSTGSAAGDGAAGAVLLGA